MSPLAGKILIQKEFLVFINWISPFQVLDLLGISVQTLGKTRSVSTLRRRV